MRSSSLIAVLVAGATLLAACNADDVALSTTSTLIGVAPSTTVAASSTTSTGPGDRTSTTARGESVSTYEIVVRIADDNGDILHVVIPPGAYTDIDLENFIQDLRDSNQQLWGVEVFDDPEAALAFQVAEADRTEADQQLLDDHHLVSLVNGDTIRFQGPLSDFGEYILAS